MDITYFGHSSFKIKGKNKTVITDPFNSEMVGIKFPKIEADIITISHEHNDHNDLERIANEDFKVLRRPGEYEIGGVSFLAYKSFHDNEKGKLRGENVIFLIEIDGFRLLHLGDLGHTLSKDMIEAIGEIDVMFVPVGDYYTIGPKDAATVINDIYPKVIIPMHYQTPFHNQNNFSNLVNVEDFVKEINITPQVMSKYTPSKDFKSSEDQILILLENK